MSALGMGVDESISIHSLRMEGDDKIVNNHEGCTNFNPLPPYGGRRAMSACVTMPGYFNPLPPYGGRPAHQFAQKKSKSISIHSLRMEGDPPRRTSRSAASAFQSTPSVWRETVLLVERSGVAPISIHSLRMEGDWQCRGKRSDLRYFNPLPPYGGRRDYPMCHPCLQAFQSTPSVWRETGTVGCQPTA